MLERRGNETTPLLPNRSTDNVPQSHESTLRRRFSDWIGDVGVKNHFACPRWLRRRGKGGRGNDTFASWAKEEISSDALVIPLLIITFSCALADSVTLVNYSTFATSMTGNTVLIAVSLANQVSKPRTLAAVSLLGFVLFGLIAGQLGAVRGLLRRSWLLWNFGTQIIILLASLGLVLPFSPSMFKPGGAMEWVYVFLMSGQGGIQVTQASTSGVKETPSAMMTTPYAALIADPALFASGATADVTSRNRRIIYLMVFWAGALAGAALARWSDVWVMTIVVAGLKMISWTMVFFARGTGAEEENLETGHVDHHQVSHPRRRSSAMIGSISP